MAGEAANGRKGQAEVFGPEFDEMVWVVEKCADVRCLDLPPVTQKREHGIARLADVGATARALTAHLAERAKRAIVSDEDLCAAQLVWDPSSVGANADVWLRGLGSNQRPSD